MVVGKPSEQPTSFLPTGEVNRCRSSTIRQVSARREASTPKWHRFIQAGIEVETLVDQELLDERYRDHPLIGNWKGYRECHLQPDWLLIYRVAGDELQLVRTGSHAELFG